MTVAPGQFVVAPLGPVDYLGVVWPRPEGEPPPEIERNKLREIIELIDDVPPLPRISLDFADWVASYTLSSPGMVLRMMMSAGRAFDPPAPRYGVRLAGAAAGAHDPGARPRARNRQERADLGQVEPGRGSRRQPRRDRRAGRCRRPRHRASARLARHAARSVAPAGHAHQGAGRGRARPAGEHQGRLHRDAARRRHRLGQDRNLFRGHRRSPGARQASAGADARDRAHQSVHYPLRGALRRPPRRMAFRRLGADARPRLARGGREQGEAGGRRPLGAVPALPRSRPDRRR